MNGYEHLVLFRLDENQYALPMSMVERIARAVEITPLPKAPKTIIGVINVQGRIVPVVDVRKRFGLPQKKMHLGDHFIIGKTSTRTIAILVDNVYDIIETAKQDLVTTNQIQCEMEYMRGVVKLSDGILLVYDLEKLLSLDEEQALEQAMEHVAPEREKERSKGSSKKKRPV